MANTRAQITASVVQLHRNVGLAKRRRRVPRQLQSRMIQVEYMRELFAIIEQVKEAISPIMATLPALVRSSVVERRLDAGEGKTVRNAINIARGKLRASITPGFLEDMAEKFAGRTSSFQKSQLLRQTKAALGVDLFIPELGLAPLIDGFVSENVSLIGSIPEKLFSDVESTITRGLQRGTSIRDLTSQISKQFNLGRNRARLIARDQIGSLTAQLNKTRQTAIGVTKYRWRNVGDERVRDAHDSREGEIFLWKNPPDGGHPGEDVQCRCSPEPVFDELQTAHENRVCVI